MESKQSKKRGYHGQGGQKKMWQDKRNNKRLKIEEQAGEDGDKQEGYELKEIKIGSAKFEEYYSTQFSGIITEPAEFQLFIETLQNKLPVTFRVNPSLVNHEALIEMF